MLEIAVVTVVNPASNDDVMMELFDSTEVRAPPDIVKCGAAQEDVGVTLPLEPGEVGDVRVAHREYFSGAGLTLSHRLGGEYPGLCDSHDGGLEGRADI